jgi:thioredoxin 1
VSVRVLHFTAPWCGPCKPVEAVLRQLVRPPAELVVVDLDADPKTGAAYGVLVLPTVVIERDGVVVTTLDGARRRADYERALASASEK